MNQEIVQKPPMAFYNLLEEYVSLELQDKPVESQTDLWIKMGDQLETSNFPKEKIAITIQQEVENKLWNQKFKEFVPREKYSWHSGHFYRVMKKHTWTDPEMARHVDPLGDQGNSSDSMPRVGLDSACREQRLDDIAYFRKLRSELPEVFDMMINLLQKDYVEVNEDGKKKSIDLDWKSYYGNKESMELMQMLKDNLTTWIPQFKRELDTRQKLLPNMMSVCIAVKESGLTIQNFCSEYYSKVKAVTEISTKAYRKYLNEVNSSTNYLDFCLDQPWKWNTMFFACPNCHEHKLKVQPLPDGRWHFVCKNKKAHKNDAEVTFPASMFTENINKIILNKGGIATKITKREGIEIKSN